MSLYNFKLLSEHGVKSGELEYKYHCSETIGVSTTYRREGFRD